MDCQVGKCIMEDRIRALETGQAETRIYVKEIREDIQEIKTTLKDYKPPGIDNSKVWQPVVIELIKLSALCITILGGIVGAAKIIGK